MVRVITLNQCGLGLILTWYGLRLLLVIARLFEFFSLGPSVFHPLERPTFQNPNSTRIAAFYENELHCTCMADKAFCMKIIICLSFNIFIHSAHPLYTLLLVTNLGITKNIVRFLAKPPLLKDKAAG